MHHKFDFVKLEVGEDEKQTKLHPHTLSYGVLWYWCTIRWIPYTKLPIESACLYSHANTEVNMFGRKCPIYDDEMPTVLDL